MPERTAFQSHISSLAAEALGIKPSALSARTEHMCASGTVGIGYAYAFIAAGLADLVMVLGVEKLNQPTGDEAILNMGTGVDREWEAAFGLTAPPCFALAAQRHMADYGTTEEQLALVGVKNHTHASKNPNAHFNKGATLDQVLGSRMIASPLRLFMCSPITDGAAAVIVASEDRARALTDTPVWIRGSGQALDGFQLTSLHEDYAHWPAMQRAAASAYKAAGVGARDVDVAEVHDCFAIAELIAYEELGFCAKGEAGPFVAAGRSDYGGDVVVNPRGGLIGCGHPLGAPRGAQAAGGFAPPRGEAGAPPGPHAGIRLPPNKHGQGGHIPGSYGRGGGRHDRRGPSARRERRGAGGGGLRPATRRGRRGAGPRRGDRAHPQTKRHGRAHRDDLRAGVGVTGERIVVSRILECALVSSAGFARASRVGGGFGGARLGPLRRSGMGEHIVMIYGKDPA